MTVKLQTKVLVMPSDDHVPPHRSDGGFIKFCSLTSYQDFSSLADDPPAAWSFARQADASHQILASQQYSPTNAYGIQRLAPTNAKGFYTRNFNFHQALNLNPAHGETWDGATNELAIYLAGTESYPENWFVHEDGTSDWTGRIQNRLIATKPRYLMAFDREDFYAQVIAPWVDELYAEWTSLKLPGAPGIFVDLCPGSRGLWRNAAGDLVPDIDWDHFTTEAEYQHAWVVTFRRLRAQFPTLQIMVNWGVDPTEDISDAVLELVDGIFFETASTFTPPVQRRSLAIAYRAAQMGKTVAFCAQYSHDTVAPDVDDFGRDYFAAFLMTLGPGHLWGGQWVKPSTAYSGAVADVSPFTRWIGPPCGDMREIMPGLWHRRFANLDVYLNVNEFLSYTVDLQGNVDDDGNGVTSVDLSPGEGAYYFRQAPRAAGYANSGYDFQLPRPAAGGRLRMPVALHLDSILGSVAMGATDAGGNLLDETTLDDVGGSITFSTPSPASYRGMDLIRGTIVSSPAQFTYERDLTGEDGRYLHVFFYARRVSGDVDALMVLLEGVGSPIFLTPLKYGVPELHHGVVQVPVSAGVSTLTFQTRPDTATGVLDFCGVRLLLTDTPDEDAAWAEYVKSDGGVPLTRGAGVGFGQTIHARSLTGYIPEDDSAPTIDLLNGTDIDGLPAKKIYEAHTTTDLSNLGNGAYQDVLTINIGDWKKARQLIAQFAVSWQQDTTLSTNFGHWRMLLDGTQIGSTVSTAAPLASVNYSAAGQAVVDLAAGAHTLKLQCLSGSAGLSLDVDLPQRASLLATIAEVS